MPLDTSTKVGAKPGANTPPVDVNQAPVKARKRGPIIRDSYSTLSHAKSPTANPADARESAIGVSKKLKSQLGPARRLLQGSTILGGIVSLPVFAAAPPFGLIPLLGAPLIGLIAQAFAKHRLHKNFSEELKTFGNNLMDAGVKERAPTRPGAASDFLEPVEPGPDGKVDHDLDQARKMYNFLQRSMWGDVKHDLISPVWSKGSKLVRALVAKKPQAPVASGDLPGAKI